MWIARLFFTFILSFATMFFSQPSKADVLIVETYEMKSSRILLQSIKQSCGKCGTIIIRNLDGDYRAGQMIASEARKMFRSGTLKLVVTIGAPATDLIVEKNLNLPHFQVFVPYQFGKDLSTSNSYIFSTDLSIPRAVEAIHILRPNLRRIGLIYSRPANLVEFKNATVEFDMKPLLFHHSGRSKFPDVLHQAAALSEVLLFNRDDLVINSKTATLISRDLHSHGVSAFSYSRGLVEVGFYAALVPDYHNLGDLIGRASSVYLEKGELPYKHRLEAERFKLHLRPDVFAAFNKRKNVKNMTDALGKIDVDLIAPHLGDLK